MKIERFSQSFDISILYGALLTNPNGVEFYVVGLSVDIANHVFLLSIEKPDDKEVASVDFNSLKDWTIQCNAHRHPPGA